jgi:LysR family cys regulon transcriptional activator
MTLNQLRCLLAIAECDLNISMAARQLNTTQPAVSRQLKQIEEELGFQVFMRRGKSLVRPTGSGVPLLERARAILGEVRNIDAIAANHRNETRGTLRVAATQALGRFVLPPALERLRRRFEGVRFRLRPGDGAECLELLGRDEIDLGLVSTEGERPPCDIAIPLFTWRRAVIAPCDHPLARETARTEQPLTLARLAEFPLIAAETATDPRTKLGRAFHLAGLEPDIVCTARDADTILTFVRNGFGVGLIAEMALAGSNDDLADLGGRDLFPLCTTWAILRADRIQRDYVFELLKALAPGLDQARIDQIMAGDGRASPADEAGRWGE